MHFQGNPLIAAPLYCNNHRKVVALKCVKIVRLIIVAPLDSVSDFHIHRLLDNIFQAMVLLAGLDDLIALRNIGKIDGLGDLIVLRNIGKINGLGDLIVLRNIGKIAGLDNLIAFITLIYMILTALNGLFS